MTCHWPRILRSALFPLASALVLVSTAWPSTAAEYPNRPVRFLIGFTAGGPVDTVARIMGQWLSDRFGQQIVVENRTGSGEISRPQPASVRRRTATR